MEVPRGILYHCYEFDEAGHIVKCDCVIPTSQNHANIQHDLEELAVRYASEGMKDRNIELLAEMLVRSYDPLHFMLCALKLFTPNTGPCGPVSFIRYTYSTR